MARVEIGKRNDLALSPEFLRRLEALAVAAGRLRASGGVSARAGSTRGGRVEFLDHRGYVAGDDIRDVDWNLYARADELFVKVFGAERVKHVHLAVDLSPSMTAIPGKAVFALRLTAAIGYIALAAGDTVRLLSAGPGLAEPPELRGAAAFRDLLARLETMPQTAPEDWGEFAARFAATRRGKGACIVVSDFWREDAARQLGALSLRGQETWLLHVLSRGELRPKAGGNVRLEDAETGEEVSLCLSEVDVDIYRAEVERHLAELASAAAKRGMRHLLCPADLPFERAVTGFLRAGGLLR